MPAHWFFAERLSEHLSYRSGSTGVRVVSPCYQSLFNVALGMKAMELATFEWKQITFIGPPMNCTLRILVHFIIDCHDGVRGRVSF